MSHHFETPTGREDPRLSLGDFYLFDGRAGFTVMAMTVNPGADPTRFPLFRDGGLYAFRFDARGDGQEDVSFRVRFGAATASGSGRHEQSFEVYRALNGETGQDGDGILIARGVTSETAAETNGVTAFAGSVHEVSAGNAAGLEEFRSALAHDEFKPEAFAERENFFVSGHVAAIVLEVPNELLGLGTVHGWATVSLQGHAPEQQVARWGLPLISRLFLADDDARESYNRTPQSGNNRPFLGHIAGVVRRSTTLAGTAADPDAYADRVLDRLGTLALPYIVGSPAAFDFAGFNGRAPHDDVMDVMLSLMTNSPISDGASPDRNLIATKFPYFTPTCDHV
jgi:hypothetical protein